MFLAQDEHICSKLTFTIPVTPTSSKYTAFNVTVTTKPCSPSD